jgi:hypothetical protein
MASSFARAVLVVVLVLAMPLPAPGQGRPPNLSKEQRQALLAAVTAVKEASPQPPSDEAWQMHVLRASDGSHYVAFSADAPPDITADTPLALYIRLTPRPADLQSEVVASRSAVEEWLLGQRSDPLPMRAHRVVQIPTGEMPVGGLAAISSRDGSGQSAAVLRLMERQRERARAEREQAERDRREELEGRAKATQDLLPFEDFDMAARVIARPGQRAVIRRAITAGPGDYDLSIGWASLDAKNRPVHTGVLTHALHLPSAQAVGLGLSSVIIADEIRLRSDIYPPDQQTAHPYAIGTTEIDPAPDAVFTNDERLSLAVQVINASPSPTSKPDVTIGFRLFRRAGETEEPAGSLSPLLYNEDTVPVDFNLALGHPILAAMAAPLRTLARGEYRLEITATDRVAGTSTRSNTTFRVVGTPTSLLASAPAFAPPFQRTRLIEPDAMTLALDALAPNASTPALTHLVQMARESRFVELLPNVELTPQERGLGALLQAIGFYALGDNPTALGLQLRLALERGAPEPATRFWMGACLAIERKDKDAVAAWQAALDGGWPSALVHPPMTEALVRLGRIEEAGRLAKQALEAGTTEPALVRLASAADIAAGRLAPAVTTLDAHLVRSPDDVDAQWLMLHALFAGVVTGAEPGSTPDGRARFVELARRYIEGGGRQRALAAEWLAFVTASSLAAQP